jgi:hypothetical protein
MTPHVHLFGALIAAVPAAELPWLSEVQTPPTVIPEDAPKLPPLLVDAEGQAIASRKAWQRRRAEMRRWWLDFLGPMPERCDLAPQIVSEETVGNVVRRLVRLQVERDCWMEAYLLHPVEPHGKLPGVVVFHSTVDYTIRQPAGLEGADSHFIGLRLAEQGYVAICPRCFIWDYCGVQTSYLDAVAELNRRHPGLRGMGKMLFDGMRAVDYLEALPFVDRKRLGCIGHSLGAKETLYAMAFDERLKAGVSSEGGIGLGFSNWEADWYLGPDIRAADFAHDNHEVLSLVAPRAFLLIGGESADGSRSWPFIENAKTVYDLLGASDRIGLLTHSSGHSLPPLAQQCAYGWLGHFLKRG